MAVFKRKRRLQAPLKELVNAFFQGFEYGSGGGTRTPGTRIMIPLLYHLSYAAILMTDV